MNREARTLAREVARACRALDLPGRSVLVAVSGGVDSSVLLHVLHQLASRFSFKLLIGHVNHGLRADSAEDAEAVRALGERCGVPVALARVEPARLRVAGPSRSRPTLQEAARRLRYAALYEMARVGNAERIATAHTQDDQAKTVLLRLMRGCGPDGLGGIPERSNDGVVVRPLLSVPRSSVLQYAQATGLAWREDPSNRSERFARSRLRTQWLPGLAAAFNPKLLRVVAALAEAQRRDAEWLASLVAREAQQRFQSEPQGLRIDAQGFEGLPAALARRLLRAALTELGMGREVTRRHLERMTEFLCRAGPGKTLELPGGLRLVRERQALRLLRAEKVRPEDAC